MIYYFISKLEYSSNLLANHEITYQHKGYISKPNLGIAWYLAPIITRKRRHFLKVLVQIPYSQHIKDRCYMQDILKQVLINYARYSKTSLCRPLLYAVSGISCNLSKRHLMLTKWHISLIFLDNPPSHHILHKKIKINKQHLFLASKYRYYSWLTGVYKHFMPKTAFHA